MKILCIGDVCGSTGCDTVMRLLPSLKKEKKIDLVIANGENSADGNGILPKSAERLFTAGVDVITGGNHSMRRHEIYDLLDNNERILRPANFPSSTGGSGICIVDMGYTTVAVINILGVVYLESMACPFDTADRLISEAKTMGAKIIVMDFHAEATSEKRALGFYLDGKISALFGTHTHVQTADEQILPLGTGYITDVGMTGPIQSVLGVVPELAISRFKTKLPVRFRNADGNTSLCGCIFEVDKSSGLCLSVERVSAE